MTVTCATVSNKCRILANMLSVVKLFHSCTSVTSRAVGVLSMWQQSIYVVKVQILWSIKPWSIGSSRPRQDLGIALVKFWSIVHSASHGNMVVTHCDIVAPPRMSPAWVTWQLWNSCEEPLITGAVLLYWAGQCWCHVSMAISNTLDNLVGMQNAVITSEANLSVFRGKIFSHFCIHLMILYKRFLAFFWCVLSLNTRVVVVITSQGHVHKFSYLV